MPKKKSEAKELKGLAVSPGSFRGKVRKVKILKELNKVKKGEVLVTNINKLPYNQFTKRAGAIVTDAGGMLSHIANLAREFNISCIVGTKVATKVLKDGDMVEVDADKGVVRVLRETKQGS